MSAIYSQIRNIFLSPICSWILTILLYFTLLLSVTGCASSVEKGLIPELAFREPPDVELGQELILLAEQPLISSSLIDKKGTLHVFVVDEEEQLNHIEILADKITKREVLGIIETKQAPYIDTVEHPTGKIRVLAGDKQYFQVTPDQEWREMKGNRCARFLPVGDDLYCAFVIKGEEISAPERTDYTYGWFLLVPIFYWSHEYASKLVLAQESADRWSVRAVVDPNTPLDTDSDFMIATDSMNNIHFLYYTSKGGGGFFVFAYGYSGGAGSVSPESKLRYAKLTVNELMAYSKDIQNKASSNNSTPLEWITVEGSPLTDKPFMKSYHGHSTILLRPLNRHFSFNKATGKLNGLMFVYSVTMDDGKRELPFYDSDSSWVELSLCDGQWSPNFNIVAAKDFPTNYRWFHLDIPLIKSDSQGNYHLLLEGRTKKNMINYLLKENNDWSIPLSIGYTHWRNNVLSLSINDSGDVFAAWVNEEGKFIGRWIRARKRDLR